MANIQEAFLDFNRWWKGEFNLDFKEREIYGKIQKFLPMPQILAFTGLRRSGKTMLMLKIAEDVIKGGLDPKNVVYFSFDEFRQIEIRQMLGDYERLAQKDLQKGKYLLLLDEIQKLEDWESQLKRIYDAFSGNAKIIISGSESLFIRRKSKETLAGRIFEFQTDLLSFQEFLRFKGVELKPAGLYEKELGFLFGEFIISMGFPELVGVKDREVIGKYVKESVVEKIVYKDLPKLLNIRDASLLESLLNIFMEEPGQIVELSDLAKELKVCRQTIADYIAYLEDSFLIRKLYNFSRSRRKVERKLKKYYPVIVSPNLLFKEDNVSKARVFECLVVNQLKAEFFWRDSYKNEVDIVIASGEPVPIEIKYGKIETAGSLAFMRKFGVEKGFVVSFAKSGTFKFGEKTITAIPAPRFLLQENGPNASSLSNKEML